MKFFTHCGTLIAKDYVRVVRGGRGSYIEFEEDQIYWDNAHIPDSEEYRFSDKYKDKVFYFEYRTNDDSYVKIYEQQKYVGYADYNPGMFYMAVEDLKYDGTLDK